MKKMEQNIQDCEMITENVTCVIGIPEEERKRGTEKIFEV